MLPPKVVLEIRKLKAEGHSLKEISSLFGCSKSSVSLYCRDLYSNNKRVYKTEEEAREKIRKVPKKKHPCGNCGKAIRLGSKLCKECYMKSPRKNISRIRNRDVSFFRNTVSEKMRNKYPRKIKKSICLESPVKAYHWNINSSNYGICIHCGKEKQFKGVCY